MSRYCTRCDAQLPVSKTGRCQGCRKLERDRLQHHEMAAAALMSTGRKVVEFGVFIVPSIYRRNAPKMRQMIRENTPPGATVGPREFNGSGGYAFRWTRTRYEVDL